MAGPLLRGTLCLELSGHHTGFRQAGRCVQRHRFAGVEGRANWTTCSRKPLRPEGLSIVDVPTHPYETSPMIPAGGCNHEMILDDPPELKLKQSGGAKVTPQDKDTILTA